MGLPATASGHLPPGVHLNPPQTGKPHASASNDEQPGVDTTGLDEIANSHAVGDAASPAGDVAQSLTATTVPNIDMSVVRTTTDDWISQDPYLATIAPGGQSYDALRLVLGLQVMGAAKPEDVPTGKGARLGELSGYLDKMLVDGGSPQLKAYLQVRHEMNVAAANKYYADQGRTPAPGELDRYVQAEDDLVALSVMTSIGAAKSANALGTATSSNTVMYQGIDLIHDVNLGSLVTEKALPSLSDIQNMSNEDVTAKVDKLLGDGGGGAVLSTRRETLRHQGGTALADFDRGLLTTIATTVKAVKNDPGYAEDLGVDTSGHRQIPPEWRGSLMMMIAYVFAMKDKELSQVVKDDIDDYDKMNGELHDAEGQKDAKTGALEGSLTEGQLKIRADMELLSTNSEMGASMISKLGEAQSAVWRK